MSEQSHSSVLLKESIEALNIESDMTIVDATIGGAGHLSAIAERLGKKGTLVGIDADRDAVERGHEATQNSIADTKILHGNFRNIEELLNDAGVHKIDGVLFDLGWSSFQLEVGKGFSFRKDEPLLMSYGDEVKLNAKDLVNSATEEDLATIIRSYSEERFAKRIARAIVEQREKKNIETSGELAEIIERAVPKLGYRKIHPATKTFQALRIAVNDEIDALKDGLDGALRMLSENGRAAVISFHSIEDRVVKNMFRELEKNGVGKVITKKPIKPSDEEIAINKRARSAKLRIFEKNYD